MALTLFYNFILIVVAILLIVSGSLGVNLANKNEDLTSDSTVQGEKTYFVIMIVIGIVLILIPPIIWVYESYASSQTKLD